LSGDEPDLLMQEITTGNPDKMPVEQNLIDCVVVEKSHSKKEFNIYSNAIILSTPLLTLLHSYVHDDESAALTI